MKSQQFIGLQKSNNIFPNLIDLENTNKDLGIDFAQNFGTQLLSDG